MDEVTPEQWLPIPGFVGFYEASSLGRIRSLPRKCCRGQVLNPSVMPNGYLSVAPSVHNIQTRDYVHRFIAATFLGPCPEGQEVRHLDGDPANNRRSNLAYGTHEENMQDMVRHGRTIAGTRHPFTKLKDDADIVAIKVAWQQGERGVDLAARYGTSPAAISRLVKGHTYQTGGLLARPREVCHFPACEELAEDGADGQGKALVYCPDPEHNNAAAKRERSRLATLAKPVRTGTCLYCGHPYVITRSDKVFCSRECKTAMRLEEGIQARREASAGATCEQCGGLYDKMRSDQRFCDETCQIRAATARRYAS